MNHLSLGWELGMFVLPALPALLTLSLLPSQTGADRGQGGQAAVAE